MNLSGRLYAAFFACAIMLGSWYPRIPDVQAAAGLEGWQLGIGLSGYPVGILILFTFGTRHVAGWSFAQSFRVVTPSLGLALVVATLSVNQWMLFGALVVAGALQGVLAVTGNVEADRMEAATGRKLLVRAHGFYSLSTVLAGLAGAAFRSLGVAPWLHLLILVPVAAIIVILATRGLDSSPPRENAVIGDPARVVLPSGAIFILFLAGGASLYLDNAGSDWSGLLLRDGYEASAALVGITVSAWALGQTAGRIGYPNLAGALGTVLLPVVMIVTAAAGLSLAVLSADPLLAIAGLTLMGFGTSALFPMAISAAAQLPDRAPAVNVASLSQLAFLAGIATPLVLGALVQTAGIRMAFGSGAVLLIIGLVILLTHRPYAEARAP
jgi:hypothetical protein